MNNSGRHFLLLILVHLKSNHCSQPPSHAIHKSSLSTNKTPHLGQIALSSVLSDPLSNFSALISLSRSHSSCFLFLPFFAFPLCCSCFSNCFFLSSLFLLFPRLFSLQLLSFPFSLLL